MSILRLQGIDKQYFLQLKIMPVKNISFQVKQGEIPGTGGASGSGNPPLTQVDFRAGAPDNGKHYFNPIKYWWKIADLFGK